MDWNGGAVLALGLGIRDDCSSSDRPARGFQFGDPFPGAAAHLRVDAIRGIDPCRLDVAANDQKSTASGSHFCFEPVDTAARLEPARHRRRVPVAGHGGLSNVASLCRRLRE